MYDSLATPPPPERRRLLTGRAAAFCAHAVEAAVDRVGDWVAPKPLSDQPKGREVSAENLQNKLCTERLNMSEADDLRAAIDEIFAPQLSKPDTTLLHRTQEKYVDTVGTMVLLGGAAVYQAAAAATQAIRNMRK